MYSSSHNFKLPYFLITLATFSKAKNYPAICDTIVSCAFNGLDICDRSPGGHCPPCMYTTSDGKFACWKYTQGTKTCPDLSPVAECPPCLTNSTLKPVLPRTTGPVSTTIPGSTPSSHIGSRTGTAAGSSTDSSSGITGRSITGSNNIGSGSFNDTDVLSSSKSNDNLLNESPLVDNKQSEADQESSTVMFAVGIGGFSVLILCIIIIISRHRGAHFDYAADITKLELYSHHNEGIQPDLEPVVNPSSMSEWSTASSAEAIDSSVSECRQSNTSSIYSIRMQTTPPDICHQNQEIETSSINCILVNECLNKSYASGNGKNDYLAAYNLSVGNSNNGIGRI